MSAGDERPVRGLQALATRLDGLTLRERALAFVIVLGLVYVAWNHLLFAPLDARRAALLAQVPGLESDIASLNLHAAQLAVARGADPDTGRRAELETLRREGARLDALLVRLTERLVPPRRMAAMLESVLTRETDLRLLRLAGLGAEPVVAHVATAVADGSGGGDGGGNRGSGRATASRSHAVETESATGEASVVAAPGLYRHGLRVEFEGGYLPTLAYLRVLESMQSRFLWEALEFDVEQYPGARVAITVYSLSLDDAWIGI